MVGLGAKAMGDPMNEVLLAQAFVQLADVLVADFDIVELFTLLTDRCVDVLDVDEAGLMLAAPNGHLQVVASSSETMRLLELFELQSDEGPCLDCYHTGEPVMSPDLLVGNSRWPRFAARTVEAGFHSVHALPMRLRGTTIGALNLFHVAAIQMPEAEVVAAQAFADIATIAIFQHRAAVEAQILNEQLQVAFNSRVLIEQAKGVVSERDGVDMQQAFNRLRTYARTNNRRLIDVAQDTIAGTLPAAELHRPSI